MKRILQNTIFAAAVGAAFVIAPALQAGQTESEKVSNLLRDAKTEAFQISMDASVLESFMRQPRLSPETHGAEIKRMTKNINDAADTVAKLASAKTEAASWQATLVDRVVPLLNEIAANTSGAIKVLNKNGTAPLATGEYKDYIEANADMANQLSSAVATLVDYAGAKSRFETLRASAQK